MAASCYPGNPGVLPMRTLDEFLAAIASCQTVAQVRARVDEIAQAYGFASFSFVDVGDPSQDLPFYITTIDPAWDEDYRSNNFLAVDPILPFVRRSNLPFLWSDVPPPARRGKRKPGGLRVLEASRDHGFQNGFVIPIHMTDRIGRISSASCVFFWKEEADELPRALAPCKHDLHILMLYCAQKIIDITDMENKRAKRLSGHGGEIGGLKDRERDVLAWAARGKTMAETADILGISESTVEEYVRGALRKLDAVTKAQAVAKAIYAGLIDV